jgi:predicted ATPase/DNA-binding winged helix-turn-helix (wHTH) protein
MVMSECGKILVSAVHLPIRQVFAMTRAIADELVFGPFRLDRRNARLLCDQAPVALTPKAFDVLTHLASRPNQLVTKQDLLSTIWPDVIVSDASVKVCILEIRKALGDGSKSPRYIQTVHRRGYRFIAEARTPAARVSVERGATAPSLFVGRTDELQGLDAALTRSLHGQRQCVFISGDPGTGKTALVENFIQTARAKDGSPLLVLVGRCFQQFGTGEPYMPVFEALSTVERDYAFPAVTQLLKRHEEAYALSASLPPSPGETAPHQLPSTGQRLLRDIADSLQTLAAQMPLVLVLEDIHWADYSTLDLISALPRRGNPARLLVIATYRRDALTPDHPLHNVVHSLQAARLCAEIALDCLNEVGVGQYLSRRFPGSKLPAALPRRLRQRTGGHPLCLVQLADDLIEQGVLSQQDGQWRLAGEEESPQQTGWMAVLDTTVPQSARAMIETQFKRLSQDEQQLLEAASAAGVEFSAAAAAAALDQDLVHVERLCDELARGHCFLESRGVEEWPDGTVATQYRFLHELYHNVVYDRVPAARRGRLHHTIGLRLERAYVDRASEEAAKLAMHFETARDWQRAMVHLLRAADAASRHYAHREAVHYLRRAHAAANALPEHERRPDELHLLSSLGVNLQVTQGWAAPEVEEVYARASALCESSGGSENIPASFPILWGIWVFHKVRSNLERAEALAQRLLIIAIKSGDTSLIMQAHQSMAVTALCMGNPQLTARHMEQAQKIYNPQRHPGNTERFGQDPGVACLAFGSIALLLLDRREQALRASEKSLALAHQLSQPTSTALALHFAAMLHQLRGDHALTEHFAQAALDLATDEGFSFWQAGARVLRGWAWSVQGAGDIAITEIQRGMDAWLATGSRTYETYYQGLLASAFLRHGQAAEALGILDAALDATQQRREHLYEAQLWHLKAQALAGLSRSEQVPNCLSRGLAIADAQHALYLHRLISESKPAARSQRAVRSVRRPSGIR